MKGFLPEDSGSWSRDNTALYTELEQDAGDRLLLQYALRYEDYSDLATSLSERSLPVSMSRIRCCCVAPCPPASCADARPVELPERDDHV